MDVRRIVNQLVVGVAVAVLASAAHADTIYVDDDNCPGPGDGSELNPYCSIQTAIDNAVDTDEIVVAPGTYNEAIDFLGKAVHLYSEAGAEVTIIDATGLDASVVTCASGEGPQTILEGFTITGGTGTWRDAWPNGYHGGGMYNYASSPTVTGCAFTNNLTNLGGGMSNYASSVTVTNCTFSDNTSENEDGHRWGGGMFNQNSNSTVKNCTFVGNSSGANGGGMVNWDSSPMVTNCTFSGNVAAGAGYGGGMLGTFNSEPTVTNCTFSGNVAGKGGAMYRAHIDTRSRVINCTFSNNTANTQGGALTGAWSVTNCRFVGNTAGTGGGMRSCGDETVINCTFSNNTANRGGGIFMDSGQWGDGATVVNCTFSNNTANGGGGICIESGVDGATLVNSTFVGNSANNNGGGIKNLTVGAIVVNSLVWANTPDQVTSEGALTYCNVQGGTGEPWFGEGCIDADPLCVDPDAGDYHLQPGSPCIDAGDNMAVPEGIDTDLDGNPRFHDDPGVPDTGNPDGNPPVDMGAYEFQGASCTLDCASPPDGVVNVTDFLYMLGQWGGPGSCDCAPPPDGVVNVTDFLYMLANWGPCP